MQLKKLVIGLMGGVVASTVLPAQAVTLDRTFNNGGTSISISGSVSPTFSKNTRTFTYYDPRAFNRTNYAPPPPVRTHSGTAEEVISANAQARTDERLRMRGVNEGNLSIGINQMLKRNLAAFSRLNLAYTPSGAAVYSTNGGLDSFYIGMVNTSTRDMAMIMLGGLPTTSVATSGTYNVLDTRAGGAVTGTLARIPNVRLEGYYAFADYQDGNPLDAGLRRGYGAIGSYMHSFGIRNNLTANLGFSKSERRNDLKYNYAARDKTGVMAGLHYNYYDWTVSLDGGVSKSDFHGDMIQDAKTTATGVRVGYDFTSRLNVYGYYGRQKTTANEVAGRVLNYDSLLEVPPSTRAPIPVDESQLFKTVKENQYGLGLNYAYHQNLSFNARAEVDSTKYGLTDGDFAKVDNKSYRLGMVLSF